MSHSTKNQTPKKDEGERRKIRRTALFLGAVAVIFYLGFILLGALRG